MGTIIDLGNDAECIIDDDGKYWRLNDKLHRTDGPAIEYAYGDKEWYLNDKEYTEKEFNVIKECPWII